MLLLKLLPLLLLVAITFSHQGHQERANRLVPGFQPYDHPSQKAVGGPPSRHSGPIGDVEWVEGRGHGEGGVPVFGSIKPTPPSSTTLSSSLILLLLVGGVGAAALLKGKAASKDESAKEEKRRDRTEEPVVPPSSTERLQTTLLSTRPIPPSSVEKENKTQEKTTTSTTPPEALITSPAPGAEVKCEEKRKVKNESETKKEEEIWKEKAKEEERKSVLKEDPVEGQAKTRIVPEIIVSPEVAKEVSPEVAKEVSPNVAKEVVPVQMEAESVKETSPTEQSTKPPVQTKTKFEDLPINLTTVDELEEVDYITKIKTFKITRWPKTHTADLVQHGPESLLSVLLPLKLQKCDEWKPDIKTFSADLSIEGANISRLLITVVTEKGEEESVAKVMTIKEYLMTISNKIIEDAVKAVREDCSLENIKCLAETIKKYRPESMEVKNVRKL